MGWGCSISSPVDGSRSTCSTVRSSCSASLAVSRISADSARICSAAQVVAKGERTGAHRHVRDAVGDDVVHLTRDPGAFGGAGFRGAQLLFGLGPFGALAEVPHQLAP